jgi:hypothetical protein
MIKLEGQSGTIRGNAVKLGSQINITCTISVLNCAKLVWSWEMNDKLITKNQTEYKQENGINGCTRKLMIDQVMAGNKRTYRCVVEGWHKIYQIAQESNEIEISVGEYRINSKNPDQMEDLSQGLSVMMIFTTIFFCLSSSMLQRFLLPSEDFWSQTLSKRHI